MMHSIGLRSRGLALALLLALAGPSVAGERVTPQELDRRGLKPTGLVGAFPNGWICPPIVRGFAEFHHGAPWLKRHAGIDIEAPIGTAIIAPADGVVVMVRDAWETGYFLIIRHAPLSLAWDRFAISLLEHFRPGSFRVGPGEVVRRGQVLGEVGPWGQFKPHLHFETYSSHTGAVEIIHDDFEKLFNVTDGPWVDPLLLLGLHTGLADTDVRNGAGRVVEIRPFEPETTALPGFTYPLPCGRKPQS